MAAINAFGLLKGGNRMGIVSYEDIKKYRDLKINDYLHDHFLLNQFHDEIMLQVVWYSLKKIETEIGPTPSPFSFFVTGSAGRFEQGIWSDQDHGIIYEETDQQAKKYFLHLGSEISKGLNQVGYKYCHGDVMASNPDWCKSRLEWQQQISDWVEEKSWESIRSLLIFTDSRALYGEKQYIHRLKQFTFANIQNNKILPHIYNNTIYYKKGIGILGQFLAETHGSFTGQVNLKETAIFPFVNSVRFLAIKEKIFETSTLSRINRLSEKVFSKEEKETYMHHFSTLLKYRLLYGNHSDYESSHYLNITTLSKVQKKEIKEILKTARSIYDQLRRLIEKE
jgi:CBS domain-containing protein